jgi:hypothetical protein
VLVEPPRPKLLAGRTGSARLKLAAGAAALLLAATSSGDLLVVAVLLAAVAGDGVGFVALLLAALATMARWGGSGLPAVAGGQAVLGAAGVYGTAAAAGSAWYAAAAIALVSPGGWFAVPFGATAGLLVAGPAAVSGRLGLVRAAGAVVGMAAALLVPRLVPWRLATRVGVALGALALLLAVGS